MRKVGQRIVITMQILEREGPSQYRHIAKYIDCADYTNVSKYLQRAVKLGLATCEKIEARNVYKTIDGWRDNLHRYKAGKPQPERIPKVQKPMVNSVWALGISAAM